jgi:hypothetical protein
MAASTSMAKRNHFPGILCTTVEILKGTSDFPIICCVDADLIRGCQNFSAVGKEERRPTKVRLKKCSIWSIDTPSLVSIARRI